MEHKFELVKEPKTGWLNKIFFYFFEKLLQRSGSRSNLRNNFSD